MQRLRVFLHMFFRMIAGFIHVFIPRRARQTLQPRRKALD